MAMCDISGAGSGRWSLCGLDTRESSGEPVGAGRRLLFIAAVPMHTPQQDVTSSSLGGAYRNSWRALNCICWRIQFHGSSLDRCGTLPELWGGLNKHNMVRLRTKVSVQCECIGRFYRLKSGSKPKKVSSKVTQFVKKTTKFDLKAIKSVACLEVWQTSPVEFRTATSWSTIHAHQTGSLCHTHTRELHSCRRKRLFIHHFLLFTQLIVQTTSAEGQGHNDWCTYVSDHTHTLTHKQKSAAQRRWKQPDRQHSETSAAFVLRPTDRV